MSYEEKFDLVRKALISYCKERIIENWERMFDMWLTSDADMEFGYGYQNKFKEQFSQYMNSEIESLLWFAGHNIVFAIQGFVSYKKNAKLNDVVIFVEHFVSAQLDNFNNWCEDISSAMYEETSEYEREFGERKEDNPN